MVLTGAAARLSSLLRLWDNLAAKGGSTVCPSPRAKDPFSGILPWELTTRQALEVPYRDTTSQQSGAAASRAVDDQYGALLLDFAGVCSIRRAVDPSLAAKCLLAGDSLVDEVRQLVRARGVDPDGPSGFQFRGAHQRDPGRLDIRNHLALDADPFDHPSLWEEAAWAPLVHRILGADAQLVWKGLVLTEPGAGDQAYHPDGPPVNREEWLRHEGPDFFRDKPPSAPLPAHCLTVFVPLVDLSRDNGPTAFLPGSHNGPMTAEALRAEGAQAGSTGGIGVPAYMDVSAGDAIVFDVRCQHAGSANRSPARRPLLYLVYGRPWYDEAEHRRLCEDHGFAQRGVRAEPLFTTRGSK